MFQTTVIKDANIQIFEPPVDVLVNADITVDVEYEVQDNATYELMGSSMPENAISDTVKLGVMKAISSTGFTMAQVQNPPAEIGNVALANIKDELLRFFGIVFTSVAVKEINPEIPPFVASMLSMQKPISTNAADIWACPNCSNNNSGKFCTECGTKKP